MPEPLPSHPDRLAETMANLAACRSNRPAGPWATPGDGAADCRIDLKLLLWRFERAAAANPAVAAHLAPWPRDRHPDLWAGTVRDGVARGFAARLEEALSLAPAPSTGASIAADLAIAAGARVFSGKELRKKRDILVASGGPRVRFTRKHGLGYTARDDDRASANVLCFEARRDDGTLDTFAPFADERARLFSPQFLPPERFVETADASELVLAGRLGRGPLGWPVRITVRGDRAAARLALRVELPRIVVGQRLRARWLGLPAAEVHHHCTPVREVVANDLGGFVADTLVRACGNLLVDGAVVATPAAADPRRVLHDFELGA